MKKHKVSIEVDFKETNERNFKIWVARMADRWQANVVHQLDGDLVQQYHQGVASDIDGESSLQQWIVDEYTKINQEFATGWEEVGDLLNSREFGSNGHSAKDRL